MSVKTSNMNKSNLPFIFLVFIIVICSIAELAILGENVFFGGHNKTANLQSSFEVISFFIVYISFNIMLYGAFFLLWRKIARIFKVRENILSFHYMMIAGIVTLISLIIKFEIHKYFADAMDAALLKNIAGGDIKTALIYVLDEAFLLIAGLAILTLIYFVFFKLVKSALVKNDTPYTGIKGFSLKKIPLYMITVALLAIGTIGVNKVNFLRNNLNNFHGYTVVTSAYNLISDVDFDGYGAFRYPTDLRHFDATIYPGALDIPNNGIDEDGFFGDFQDVSAAQGFIIADKINSKPKHIITIILESARADIISKKINQKLVAPHLTSLAKEGLLIDQAFSHTGSTATSLATFFSGRHGVFEEKDSIFRILKNNGYEIALFSGQDESWGGLDVKLSTRQNTDHFYDAQVGVEKRVFKSRRAVSIKLSEETLWTEFKKYSDQSDWSKPHFIYFNMQAAHFPYYHTKMTHGVIDKAIPRSEMNAGNKDWLQSTYWNALNHADLYIGKIIAELKEKNLWNDTLLVISGDHGEELFDDNHLGHGFMLSDVQTKVPLIVSQKDFKVVEPVGHVDMKNYILSYAFGQKLDLSKKEAAVFQMIGSLHEPAKISLRYPDHKQIKFDFRNMLVFPIDGEGWMSYQKALEDKKIKSDLKKLITHWENLRWQSRLNEKNEVGK